MLIPKLSSYYNGKCSISFGNPKYLKKAQWEKSCLYNVKFDKHDLANLFAPESEETIRLVEESRSKLSKDIAPYDYKKLNKLCDTFVPQNEKSLEQLTFTNAVKFENALKEEMIDDLKYVQSLEMEVDYLKSQLESEKAHLLEFDDPLLQEYLEVAFRKSTCFVRDLQENDLLMEPETQDHINEPSSSTMVPEVVPITDMTDTSSLQELELLFSPMFDEYFHRDNQAISSSSAFTDKRQQQDTTSSTSTTVYSVCLDLPPLGGVTSWQLLSFLLSLGFSLSINMSLHSFTDDEYEPDDNGITLISRLDVSNPLHLHPNDSAALTVFDALVELPRCTCHATEDFKKHNQLMKLMKFLMGLDDAYMQIRSRILSRETLLDVRCAYSIIYSEESDKHSFALREATSEGGWIKRSQSPVFNFNVATISNAQRPQIFGNFARPPNMTRPSNLVDRRPNGGSAVAKVEADYQLAQRLQAQE
ncbi:hypothetical protein Tco_0109674 [Tanacetum coccineum]